MGGEILYNKDSLGAALSAHLDKPRAYIGCMKSGEVISEPRMWSLSHTHTDTHMQCGQRCFSNRFVRLVNEELEDNAQQRYNQSRAPLKTINCDLLVLEGHDSGVSLFCVSSTPRGMKKEFFNIL
ncbi:hypothetical protein K2173_010372 [Erythroxylum novogranatense]|uniref:Uncharacterized protein n=1 Tax=Erythroxylum novogranatense TaxID=1862640 RepID=A0AAV8TDG8_9ROSI|nr:hypothetical protein K2173_010372 [Erythroxylum novogranatense]